MIGLSLGEGPSAKNVLDTSDFDAEEGKATNAIPGPAASVEGAVDPAAAATSQETVQTKGADAAEEAPASLKRSVVKEESTAAEAPQKKQKACDSVAEAVDPTTS